MEYFKQYRRNAIAELRPVSDEEIRTGFYPEQNISVSVADKENGSPKIGDMIARNPENHKDQWLVAKDYFEINFEPV